MSHHEHEHHGHHNHQTHPKRSPHKDWRIWLAVGLMLAGMGVYVITMDESVLPAGGEEAPVEAIAE